MKKFKVTIPYVCYVTTEVQADDKDDAIDLACMDTYVGSFCGNGGNGDKLIGVTGDNESIEINQEPLEMQPFEIMTEEI